MPMKYEVFAVVMILIFQSADKPEGMGNEQKI